MKTIIIDYDLRDDFDIQEFISEIQIEGDNNIIFVSDKYSPEVEDYMCGVMTSLDDVYEAESVFGCDIEFTSGTDLWGFVCGNMDFDIAILKEGVGDMYKKDERLIEYRKGWKDTYMSLTSFYFGGLNGIQY
jgi:hypothetical protein